MTTVSIDFLIKYLVAAQAAYGSVLNGLAGGLLMLKAVGLPNCKKIDFGGDCSLVVGGG